MHWTIISSYYFSDSYHWKDKNAIKLPYELICMCPSSECSVSVTFCTKKIKEWTLGPKKISGSFSMAFGGPAFYHRYSTGVRVTHSYWRTLYVNTFFLAWLECVENTDLLSKEKKRKKKGGGEGGRGEVRSIVCAKFYKTDADEKACFQHLYSSHSIWAACFELWCAHCLLEGRARSFSRAKSFLCVLLIQVNSHCCHALFHILLANSVVSYL